jgi:hypothetical protein
MASKKWQVHLVKVLALALVTAGATSQLALAQQQNPVQYENTHYAGDSGWQIPQSLAAVAHDIEGYASAASVSSVTGTSTISFYVSTKFQTVDLDIYRIGWYGGAGGRHMQPTVQVPAVNQGTCPVLSYSVVSSGPPMNYTMTVCNWAGTGQGTYTLTVPQGWVSGVYLVKLSGLNNGTVQEQSYIPFVVTDGHIPKLLFQHSVMTDEAYNDYGDGSLYTMNHPKVSFSRPFANDNTSDNSGGWNHSAGNFFRWEFHMIRFMEGEGNNNNAYDVGYISDIDLHVNGVPAGILALMSVGHDEYWTLEMRLDVQTALQNGLNLGFFSADDADWDTRLEADTNPYGTMVCFRSTTADPWYNDGIHDQRAVTVKFRQQPVNMPQNQIIGIEYYAIINSSFNIGPLTRQPAWLFNGVSTGTTFLNKLLGYEADAYPLPAPAPITIVAQSSNDTNCNSCAYTTVYQPNPPNNPTVFAAGTFQWSWGLDQFHVDGFAGKMEIIDTPTKAAAIQMTKNIFAQFCGSQGCN